MAAPAPPTAPTAIEPEAAFRALASGVPLVTATRRLAREWRRRYDDWQRSAAQPAQAGAVWPSALVLPWDAWVRVTWESALDAQALRADAPVAPAGTYAADRTLLSEAQARALWERLVAGAAPAGALLRPQAAAREARRAWRMLAQWRLPPPAPGALRDAPLEARAFAQWAQAWRRRCGERGWLDPADLPAALLEALAAGAVPLAPRLFVAGFDRAPPIAVALLEAVHRAGTELRALAAPRHAARPRRLTLPDAEAEAWAAARWARHWLETEPAARIAIAVPDLESQRSRLMRALEDVLVPAALLPTEPGGDFAAERRPFAVSHGAPLAAYPLVATALALLALTPRAQPLDTLSALLRSPFVAGAEQEAALRGVWDVQVRALGAAELTPQRLAALVDAEDAAPAGSTPARLPPLPLLAAALRRWHAQARGLPAQQAPSAWATAFDGLLAALGWPGERPLDSAEHQAQRQWHGLLEELARLDAVLPRMARGEALAALREAAQTPWQPQGSAARVEVLDVHEAAESDVDHLWVLGLHADAWPPAPRPSPYLPLALQRRHGLPRASLEAELALAREETARLCSAAPDVVFSHPRSEGDQPLRPSPLVRHLPELAPDTLPPTAVPPSAVPPAGAAPTLRDTIAAAGRDALEPLREQPAPPIATGTPVHGGTSLFQEQAACPFRAFAHHRLHARAPETPEAGLDAAARGTLVHAALEETWRRIGDHAALLALDDARRDALLGEAVEAALTRERERHRDRLTEGRAELERRRLPELLRAWLDVERGRTPFALAAAERRTELELGGITVSGRVDRIDRLPDGRHVLIDYKTGRPRVDAWWGERPDEPQLPLYAVSGGEPLAGVAFAQVRRERPRFRGVADPPALLPEAVRLDSIPPPPGAPPFASWQGVVDAWRGALEGLARGFRTGDARVDPKRADTCRTCDLPGLCRIAELRPALAGSDDESAEPPSADGDAGGDSGEDDRG